MSALPPALRMAGDRQPSTEGYKRSRILGRVWWRQEVERRGRPVALSFAVGVGGRGARWWPHLFFSCRTPPSHLQIYQPAGQVPHIHDSFASQQSVPALFIGPLFCLCLFSESHSLKHSSEAVTPSLFLRTISMDMQICCVSHLKKKKSPSMVIYRLKKFKRHVPQKR